MAATPAADLVIKAGPDRLSAQPYAYRHRLARARARIGAALGVIVSLGSLCCESAGDKFDVYYPTALGQRGSNIRYSPGEMGQTLFPAIRLFPKSTSRLGICDDCGSRQKVWFGPNHSRRANFLIAAPNSNPFRHSRKRMLGVLPVSAQGSRNK